MIICYTPPVRIYQPLPEDAGVIKSRVVPGFWLDVAALLNRDMKRVLQVLQAGVAAASQSQAG